MKDRGYQLVDVPVVEVLWPELDCIVAVMEYVRLHFDWFCPELPPQATVDLFAGVTSHSIFPIPLLGIHLPRGLDRVDIRDVEDRICRWLEGQDKVSLGNIAQTISSPTWSDLLKEARLTSAV